MGLRRSVTTGYSSDGMVEIASGLTDDDRVITVGHIGLKNEAKVTIIGDDANNSANDDDGDAE